MNCDFMAKAIELAVENVRSGRGGPFGAVVVKAGTIVASGVNSVTRTNDPTAHAELTAIREACRILRFNSPIARSTRAASHARCAWGAIDWARPMQVYFAASVTGAGFDDSFIYRQIAMAHGERSIPMRQCMREESLAAFRAWRASPDRIDY
jgi:guanine deaminase